MSRIAPLAVLAAAVAGLVVASQAPHPDAAVIAGIAVAFTIASWAFGLFVEPLTTLLFFLLAVTFRIAKPEVIFSGFASKAWWLVFGGAITAVAVHTSGLGGRLAGLLSRAAGRSYARSVAAVASIAVGLAFLVPSTNGRILLLMPVVLAFAERLGLGPGRPGYAGLVVTVAAASYMPSTAILPANVPNSVLLGAADSLYGIRLTYGPYLLLHFPVLGALKTALLVWVVCRLFPEKAPLQASPPDVGTALSPPEKRLCVVLAVSLLLFATDSLHGISPAWVSLGTGIVCLLPALSLVSPKDFAERTNLAMLLYIAGILGLGAVVADTGLSRLVSAKLVQMFPVAAGRTATDAGVLTAIGSGLGLLTTVTGLPAVLTPLAGDFAAATGLPLLTVLMLQVPAFSTVFLPFESPPIMIALQLGRVGVGAATKLCLALAALTVLLLFPLDFLWWRILGYLP